MAMHTLKGPTTEQPAYAFSDDTNTGVGSAAADQLDLYCGGTIVRTFKVAGSAESSYEYLDTTTAIADNSATAIFTVTVPNVDTSAVIELDLLAAIGGGGDNWESSRYAKGAIIVARTTGANAVPAAATLTLAQIATVSGGQTFTLAYGVSAVSGDVGATNTFTVTVTIARAGGTANAHQCVWRARVLNSNVSGITIAAA